MPGIWNALRLTGRILLTAIFIIAPVGFLQIAIETHWTLGLLVMVILAVAVCLGIRDFRLANLTTEQGITVFVSILLLTIAVFAFVSFALYKFDADQYRGFPTQVLTSEAYVKADLKEEERAKIESRYISGIFIGFYAWQLFEIIPGLKVNEALLWSSPVQQSGFWAKFMVLSFRVVIIFVVFDVFRKWWVGSKIPQGADNTGTSLATGESRPA